MRSVNPEIQGYGDNMSNYGYLMHSELYHHGIKGQKWGVRRYQNDDGSLTEAGKRRYRVYDNLDSAASKMGARRRYRDVEIAARKAAKEKTISKGKRNFANKKERKQYINDTTEGYINKQYNDWFKDEGPLNRTRDESAYRYNRSVTTNALRNVGQNTLGALTLNTVGIGMFGVSRNKGKIYNDIYKETTRRLKPSYNYNKAKDHILYDQKHMIPGTINNGYTKKEAENQMYDNAKEVYHLTDDQVSKLKRELNNSKK